MVTLSVISRRLSGWKPRAEGIWSWFQGEKRALYIVCFDRETDVALHLNLDRQKPGGQAAISAGTE
jgi:hypothetical protein